VRADDAGIRACPCAIRSSRDRLPRAYDRMRALDVEFTQEPVSRYGNVDAGFRDPSGNGWKMIEARR